MNIQRKYSLPNCTLLLEGLSDASRATHFQELRPELSILVNAECYISGYTKPLTGGREFFESLVRAVSAYAQEFLSSVPHSQAHNSESELVQFQKIDSNQHRLMVHSDSGAHVVESYSNNGMQLIQIDLNTVQLFDLVEAIDQFFADSRTLPELTLQLQPVARRHGGVSQALIKQAVPASVGVTSLAVAAVAFTLIPAPETRPPQPKTQEDASKTNSINNPATASLTPTPTPNELTGASPTLTPTLNPTTAATSTPGTPPTVNDLEALLNTSQEITDASQLRALNRQLYNQINPKWVERSKLSQDLVFRVGVAKDGAIVGYKAVNKQANDAVEKTPLASLLYNPANRATNEALGQFRVVFTRKGALEVSPWRGYTQTPDVIGTKITDPNAVKDLNQKLYNNIRQNWSTTPTFVRDLKYRVAVNKEGVIADYEPLNQAAVDYFRLTPLPKMFQEIYGSNFAPPNNKEALAHFQVVFKPGGALEIVPWYGYR
ncbi:DUF4335 domain-containing protein [Brasilonema sp. UFV-L1]|uniref:DUF4335 domain-containing protein n=1 Tax=Brasilonema sp. UFV-L1 TaxID=2234130 RepID=UPI00145E8EAF|nr:DUF4335 domain-containing protein [Brasilonema sp. UFV-L1]NMG08135.1 hypothetical protein [Brasilonema sp. UFV-L1]